MVEVTYEDRKDRYTSDHIMIASGSAPDMEESDGSELCMSSDDIFNLTEVPTSMIVVGGGYIGIEMAQIMNAFGCKVTVLTRDIFLRHVDPEVVEVLVENMRNLGITVLEKSPFTKI